MGLVEGVGSGGDKRRLGPPVLALVVGPDALPDVLGLSDVGEGCAVLFAQQDVDPGVACFLAVEGRLDAGTRC
jgi:hypothetical protein